MYQVADYIHEVHYINPLEQLASQYSVIRLPDRFLPQTKDILLPPNIF